MTDAQDRVRVSVSLAIQPELALRVFTEEIDQWWKRELVRDRGAAD